MEENDLFSYVIERLDANKGKLKNVADASGVPYSTVSKIAQRVTPNPGVLSVQALANHFKREGKAA